MLPAGLDVYEKLYQGYNEVLDAYSQWLLDMRTTAKWEVIDLHGPMNAALAEKRKADPDFTYAKDGVHPSPEGQLLIAKGNSRCLGSEVECRWSPNHPFGTEILSLVQKETSVHEACLAFACWTQKRPGVKPWLTVIGSEQQARELDEKIRDLARQRKKEFPKTSGEWHGYPKHDLVIAGKSVTVVAPKTAAAGLPWIWHGEFFGHKPILILRCSERDFTSST